MKHSGLLDFFGQDCQWLAERATHKDAEGVINWGNRA